MDTSAINFSLELGNVRLGTFAGRLLLGISRFRVSCSFRTLAWDLAFLMSLFGLVVEEISIDDFPNDLRSRSFVRE